MLQIMQQFSSSYCGRKLANISDQKYGVKYITETLTLTIASMSPLSLEVSISVTSKPWSSCHTYFITKTCQERFLQTTDSVERRFLASQKIMGVTQGLVVDSTHHVSASSPELKKCGAWGARSWNTQEFPQAKQLSKRCFNSVSSNMFSKKA